MKLKSILMTVLLALVAGGMTVQAETVTVSLAPSTNGTFSNSSSTVSDYYTTWTSNFKSGLAGLTITTGGNLAMCEKNVSNYGGNLLALKTTTANSKENFVVTAPAGYTISGYSMTIRLFSSSNDGYRFYNSTGTQNGFYTASVQGNSFSETNLNVNEITLGVQDTKGTSSNYLCITAFTITLSDTDDNTFTKGKVFTINNTNSGRGAMMYAPSQSTKYVWSSGKNSQTFDATSANCQWVIYPTGTANQYYLYNVGAGKFAIPSGTASTASWIFSPNAVAVTFIDQGSGVYKIKTVNTDTYAAVSNNYAGPIINYNDVGGNFTITKVTGNQSAAVTTALEKLYVNRTELTAAPTGTGWYAMRVKNDTYAGQYVYTFAEEFTYSNNTKYPLGYYSAFVPEVSIADATYYAKLTMTSYGHYWQMPNGRYIQNAKPVSGVGESSVSGISYNSTNGFTIKSSSWYFKPLKNQNDYFIGESSSEGTYYDIYPVDLTAAGLTAWQVFISGGAETMQLTCNRSDVSGLSSVYNNGYFFLPTGETPTSSDFSLAGMTSCSIDATNHTITVTVDPNLALTADDVTVEQGWQTAGRNSDVYLLRVTANPFQAATGASMTVSLKNGTEGQITGLTLYEASSNSPEVLGTGSGVPTLTQVSTATISGSTATFTIGNLSAGTHYYWLKAAVKSDATLGAVLDAAVTALTYTCNNNETTLDLTSVGDPADRGAMVFNVRSYPFLPRDNGSRVYRIPAMIVADDGSIVVAADKRYQSHTDIGNGGHVIDIVVRRSTDGGKTWSAPVTIAKGEGSTASGGDDKRCGFGDPSLVKGKDGKLYCLFAAGNEGYFYGQKGMCMSVSTDNGVTWSSGEGNPPVDLYWSGAIKNVNTAGAGGFGLYDYFVTSGRGLYIPEDDILMYLIPAQTMTSATEHTGDSQDYVFYSRDGGESWYFSETPMVQGGDEAKIIQMNDGSLFGSIRKGGNRRFNTATYTKNDDGKTLSFNFGTQWENSQLYQASQNNQDVYYYQRETAEGKTDVIIHSITTGNHVNLKLYYSTDQGLNWTEFLNVQTKGTRYVTMDKNPANGSLYLLFEDQSLNSAGGYTDYNHYPLNFIEITRDQLVELIPALKDYAVPEYLETNVVKNTVYQTGTGCDSYGTFSDTGSEHWARTWTSNASSGIAGLTVSTESGYGFDKATVLSTRVMTLRPSANGATDTYTINAPAGYLISSYTIGGAVYTGGTYRITAADGTTTGDITSTTEPTNITVNNVNAESTTFTFYGASQSNWFAITNFTITLAKPLTLNAVNGDPNSYATLYLPFDVTTTGATKAYYIATANNGKAQLTETSNNGTEIPANTAVLLVNENKDASTILNMTTGLSSVVSEDANLLKGTLVEITAPSDAYVFSAVNDVPGFYKYTGSLAQYKAYLKVPSGSGNAKGFILDFSNQATGLNSVESRVESVESVYDLSGRKVNDGSQLPKGIFIVNGKKIVVK